MSPPPGSDKDGADLFSLPRHSPSALPSPPGSHVLGSDVRGVFHERQAESIDEQPCGSLKQCTPQGRRKWGGRMRALGCLAAAQLANGSDATYQVDGARSSRPLSGAPETADISARRDGTCWEQDEATE